MDNSFSTSKNLDPFLYPFTFLLFVLGCGVSINENVKNNIKIFCLLRLTKQRGGYTKSLGKKNERPSLI